MKRHQGFTLIELAIVLIIVTLLIGGLAVPLSAQIQARRIAETRKTLDAAQEAIVGFAMTHPGSLAPNRRLPCPDTDGDGRENLDIAANSCQSNAGWLPWVNLGVGAQDAWGNRLRYSVLTKFATEGFRASSTPADPLVVCTAASCSTTAPDVAADVVYVLVSHGPNGWGARNLSGSTLAAPSGPDEIANLDNDRIYVSRTPTDTSAVRGEFDDLVAWTPFVQLIAQVCPAGSSCAP